MRESSRRTKQWILAGLTIGAFLLAVLYRQFGSFSTDHSSLFFHGVPALLALLVIFSPTSSSLVGRTFVGVTIGLLIAGTLLGEGFICIVIASPLVYGLTWLLTRGFKGSADGDLSATLLILVVVGSAATGLVDPGIETVETSYPTDLSTDEISSRFATAPSIGEVESGLLALPFPSVREVTGHARVVGDEVRVRFSDDGELVMSVTDHGADFIEFAAASDTSVIARWMTWKTARFSWVEGAASTEVTLVLTYERGLDPGWYFGPLIRQGVEEAADHLLVSYLG